MSESASLLSLFCPPGSESAFFREHVESILQKVFSDKNKPQTSKEIEEALPLIKWNEGEEGSLYVSVFLICMRRNNLMKFFFYDMISRWLIPGKYLDLPLHFSTHFQFLEDPLVYTVYEVALRFETLEELMEARKNFPFLQREILFGSVSFYHASRILEMKGLSLDMKTAMIQEKMAMIVRRFPKVIDYDVFEAMQHFLISSKHSFKQARTPSQMTCIIYTLYFFQRRLQKQIAKEPFKRHLCLKLKKTFLQTPFGFKEVLAIFVGLNFLKEHELFEERHVISALSHFLSGIQSIEDSFFAQHHEEQSLSTFYLEVEKENAEAFLNEELLMLKERLPSEIQSRIEQLVSPLFMPRNEEEVMRNILTLSHQLRYLKDLPQIMISFDEQTDTELIFTVIIVRIMEPKSRPFKELFCSASLALSIDRVKTVGKLRRRYVKEACVMRLRLPGEDFLREDYSVDLVHARLCVVQFMESILGEVRDYNGGMISKQHENFIQLKRLMGTLPSKYTLLLQNFFHAIFPVHLSTTLDPLILKKLFTLIILLIESPKEAPLIKSQKQKGGLLVVLKLQDLSLKQKAITALEGLRLFSNDLLSVPLEIFDFHYLGFIYFCTDHTKQKVFLETLSLQELLV